MTSSPSNTSWAKSIKSPFRKARTFFNNNHSHQASNASATSHKRDKSRHLQGHDDDNKKIIDDQLEGEVMACTYEDVQVMWSILDKSNNKPRSSSSLCNVNS